MSFDPRLTPVRPDLAAAHLKGKVEAPRFVDGTLEEVIVGVAPLRKEPSHDAPLLTEALRGERVTIYESDEEGWAWGQLAKDGYVGFLPSAALLPASAEPTHKVAALRTFVFPGPSIKLPPIDTLPMGATVAVARTDDTFAITSTGGYIPKPHVVPLATHESDFVAVAERYLNVPYLWGGKTGLGLDCSGLVQISLNACGIDCPRDSDMQEKALGKPVSLAGLQNGDLVFWKGHVAIVRGRNSLLHANAFHMAVAVEPVAEAVARIAAGGSQVTSVRRLR
jgi:cell wall-associated NlpC family hydrolase